MYNCEILKGLTKLTFKLVSFSPMLIALISIAGLVKSLIVLNEYDTEYNTVDVVWGKVIGKDTYYKTGDKNSAHKYFRMALKPDKPEYNEILVLDNVDYKTYITHDIGSLCGFKDIRKSSLIKDYKHKEVAGLSYDGYITVNVIGIVLIIICCIFLLFILASYSNYKYTVKEGLTMIDSGKSLNRAINYFFNGVF